MLSYNEAYQLQQGQRHALANRLMDLGPYNVGADGRVHLAVHPEGFPQYFFRLKPPVSGLRLPRMEQETADYLELAVLGEDTITLRHKNQKLVNQEHETIMRLARPYLTEKSAEDLDRKMEGNKREDGIDLRILLAAFRMMRV